MGTVKTIDSPSWSAEVRNDLTGGYQRATLVNGQGQQEVMKTWVVTLKVDRTVAEDEKLQQFLTRSGVAPGSRSSLHWPRYWGLMKVAKRWEEHSIDYILLWSMEQFLGLPNLFILYYTICHRAYSSSERYLLTITYYKLIPKITHYLPWFWEYSRKFAR